MSDPVYMDFEEPPLPKSKGKRKPKREKKGGKEPEKTQIPSLPKNEVALTGDEVKRGVSERARAAANLKVEGYSYMEIADMMEYETPADAKRAVESVLAAIHGPGDYESLRLIVTARAERQLQRSMAMANADFLVLDDGERVPNLEKLRWHQQAGVDLMNYATITGAKAPTKVEITPGEAELERLAAEMARRSGLTEIIDAEVIELDVVPRESIGDDDDAPLG